ncbi:MAG: hypothetical protein ACHQHN_08170 [Sphingobacteriales bacterium]
MQRIRKPDTATASKAILEIEDSILAIQALDKDNQPTGDIECG